MTNVGIPDPCLVVLLGASASGKSTFAARHFAPTEVVSSDHCRALVGDDENDMRVTSEAFALLHFIAATRLALGRLTVVDATNVQADARAPLLRLAREHNVTPVAIVLDMPERVCLERNRERPDRHLGAHVIHRHVAMLRRSIGALEGEGFREVAVLRTPSDALAAEIVREPGRTDPSDERRASGVAGADRPLESEPVDPPVPRRR